MSIRDVKIEGLEMAIEEVKRRLDATEAWSNVYRQALIDMTTILEAMVYRMKRGEYPHPTSQVMGAGK